MVQNWGNMNYDRLIYRIIRLDKNIYLELIQVTENFQRAFAVWAGTCIIGILAGRDLVRALVKYAKDELPALTQRVLQSGVSEEELNPLNEAIDLLVNQPFNLSISSLVQDVLINLIGLIIQIGAIYLFLKFIIRRETNWKNVLVVIGFSTIPLLFNFSLLFFSSLIVKIAISFTTSIFSLMTLGSGLKQIYDLRNIETIFLVISFFILPNFIINLGVM